MRWILALLIPFPVFANCDIQTVLLTLRPGAEWNLRGDTANGLEWIDKTQTKPTKSEIDQGLLDCQAKEFLAKTQKTQAIADAKNAVLTPQARLDALIKAIDLK